MSSSISKKLSKARNVNLKANQRSDSIMHFLPANQSFSTLLIGWNVVNYLIRTVLQGILYFQLCLLQLKTNTQKLVELELANYLCISSCAGNKNAAMYATLLYKYF